MVGECHHVAQLAPHTVTTVLLYEEAFESLRRDRSGNLLRVHTLARLLQRIRRQFTGEYLQQMLVAVSGGVFHEEHRQRVSFLARGAADRPDAQTRVPTVLALENLA